MTHGISHGPSVTECARCCGSSSYALTSAYRVTGSRGFSYAWWSLPVTWQKWLSHHSIRHGRKTYAERIFMALFYRTFTLQAFLPFLLLWPLPWPDDLHIRTWPVFPRDTGYPKMNFPCQVFRKLLYCGIRTYRQTGTSEIIYQYAASRVVNEKIKAGNVYATQEV